MMHENEYLSVMIYFYNKWSFDECMLIFDGDKNNPYDIAHHIWNKYADADGRNDGIMALTFELSDNYLNKIINRACELYNGRHNR